MSIIFDDVTFEYIARVRLHDDETSSVLRGHLLVEYLLNKIIESKCKNSNTILKDSRSYTFLVKLQLVYSMGLIPECVWKNAAKINKIRNELAHNLDFDEKKIDMILYNSEGEPIVVNVKGKRYPIRFYLKLLAFDTLTQLRNHMMFNLRLLQIRRS